MAFQWKRNRRNARRLAKVNFLSRKQRRKLLYEDKKGAQKAGLQSTRCDHI